MQEKGGQRGRKSVGRWGNLALMAVHCRPASGGKPMHHSKALSRVHSYD